MTYLTIITTALVITQIIRLIQNSISLHRQSKLIDRDLSWIKDRDITQRDFDTQKECLCAYCIRLLNFLRGDAK